MSNLESHINSLIRKRYEVIGALKMEIDALKAEIDRIQAERPKILAHAKVALAESDPAYQFELFGEVVDWLASVNGVSLHPGFYHTVAEIKKCEEYRAKAMQALEWDLEEKT
jgi:hypothetical protein